MAIAPIVSILTTGVVGYSQQAELQPWQVTSLSTFSPSGRPGSSPYSIINLTITDPNTINAGPAHRGTAIFPPTTANCSTYWDTWSETETPYNKTNACSEVQYGYWTFEMRETSGTSSTYIKPTENVDIVFTHVDNVTVIGSVYTKTFVGTAHFELGDNMSGVCGASGVCSWGLKSNTTVPVKQTMTACQGEC